MLAILAFTAGLLLPPQDPPATSDQIASARAAADRLIADAEAGEFFVNSTTGGVPEATHVASGLACTFEGGPRDRIMVFPVQDDSVPRGDDVGCASYVEDLDIDVTLYATRYRPLPSEDQVLADAEQAIRNRWPDAKGYEEGLPTLSTDGRDPPKAVAYEVTVDGKPKLTMALVAHRDAWGFKARATGPLDEAMAVALYAGVLFEGALMDRDTD